MMDRNAVDTGIDATGPDESANEGDDVEFDGPVLMPTRAFTERPYEVIAP